MSRTNIDLDDDLVADVIELGAKNKKEAVHLGLELARRYLAKKRLSSLKGIGWDGDLEESRL